MSALFSSLTPSEQFRLTGSLSAAQIEELLAVEPELERLRDMDGPVQEALCQYPAEDFLSDVIGDLRSIAKRLRGDNRTDLLGVIEKLDDIAQTTFYAADYGRSELRKVLAVIKPTLEQKQ